MWRPALPSLPTSPKGWIKLAAILLVLLGLIGGGVWGWLRYKAYKASPEAAIETLNKAIASKDFALFSTIVQGHLLATQLANATQSNPIPDKFEDESNTPHYPPALDATGLKLRSTSFLASLQTLFTSPEPPNISGGILPVLPNDILVQLAAKPFAVRYSDPLVFAETTITLPFASEPLPLRFLLQKIGKVWQVTQFISAPALVSAYHDAVIAELERRKKAAGLSLQQNRNGLARYMPNARCQAGVTRISGNIPLLVLNLQTDPNPGPETLNNWGFACILSDAAGNVLAKPHTNSIIHVPSESPIKESWSPDISEEQYRMFEAAGPLTCVAIPEYVVLNTGQIFKDPQK